MSDTIPPFSELLISLTSRIAKFNADELDAIDFLVSKLETGRIKHGPLDLATDTRDWAAEQAAELADREYYRAFAAIQQRRQAGAK